MSMFLMNELDVFLFVIGEGIHDVLVLVLVKWSDPVEKVLFERFASVNTRLPIPLNSSSICRCFVMMASARAT